MSKQGILSIMIQEHEAAIMFRSKSMLLS